MFYERIIKYVDVYENNEKIQNAGFVRLEVKEDKLNMRVQISGLRPTDTMSCPIVLLGGRKEVIFEEMWIEGGSGVEEFPNLSTKNIANGLGYDMLEEIQIRPVGSRLLRCVIKTHAETQEVPEEILEDVSEDISQVKSEAELLKEAFLSEKRMRESEYKTVEVGTDDEAEDKSPESVLEEAVIQQPAVGESVMKAKQPAIVQEPKPVDKWQQLLTIYPHIRPFEDRREYLLMKPQDFVILTEKYFSLVGNSFLLHGYYNYDHLIMSKERRPEGERFYIGVPGNFYDKEKQVAIMFGFESFEGKREPARTGDFGYYMMPVEI